MVHTWYFVIIAVNPDIQLYLIVVSSIFIGLCGSLSL